MYCTLHHIQMFSSPRGLRIRSAGRSPAEIVGSKPTGGMDGLSVVSVVRCQVEVSATS